MTELKSPREETIHPVTAIIANDHAMQNKIAAEIAALLNRCVLLRLKANAMSQDANSVARRIEKEKERQAQPSLSSDHSSNDDQVSGSN